MQNTTLFHLSWRKYLTLLFLLLGTGFFASGVITWIAANWDYFSRFEKLYGVQSLFGVSILLSGFFYYHEAKKKQATTVLPLVFAFLAAVLLGAIFALIGQTYQTGADPWELFAIWSVCQIPFLLLFPNVASALLLLVTANVALSLAISLLGDVVHMMIFLNMLFLVCYEYFGERLRDQHWRILPKIALLILVFAFGWALIVNSSVLLSWLLSAGLVYYYKERRFDFLNLIVLFFYLVVSICTKVLLSSGEDFLSDIFLVTILAFGGTIGAIITLIKWFKWHNPTASRVTWHIYPLFILLIIFCTGLLLITLFFSFGLEDEQDLIYPSILFLIIALVMHFNQKEKADWFDIAIDMFMATGFILYFIFFLFDGENDLYLALMAILSVFLYQLRSSNWLRFLIASLFIIAFLVYIGFFDLRWYAYYEEHLGQFVLSAQQWIILGGLLLYYFFSLSEERPYTIKLLPIAWAMLLVGLAMNLDIFNRWTFLDTAQQTPEMSDLNDWFHVITGYFFTALTSDTWLIKSLHLLISITPIIFFVLISRRFELAKFLYASVLLTFLALCLGFIAVNETLACISLLLLAYLSVSRVLFALALLGVIMNLSYYYYLLSIPLLHKSFLLMGVGIVLALVTFVLSRYNKAPQATLQAESHNTFQPQTMLRKKLGFTLLATCLIAFATNYTIHKYEDILTNGESIILKTAPVDPRSLMQGDYMTLNYEILADISEEWGKNLEEEKTQYFVYALLKRDSLGIATLCRLETKAPTTFDGCTPNIYLPVNVAMWWPRLPSQDYFFAEGKGEYYAQAEYAEYRFKGGKALLFRLLDKNLKAL
ncbi:GDYXXLXY domain-containing protein [Pasteurella multocida]|uniref:GDYXXLXY domain-containing protein n=1 Tax=Pasteurella multocida TaxID=747 RepID=UPI000C19C4A0|nr:GDYXXLXY domain-containing protein [Pasteurella multocida]MCL7775007.1 GDYXXLXY domain-containing protein [Pasteurella multocida]MCL8063987.1 GDYXXLXY domain-containing protein [Pasteurella multocida]MCL8066240.1 GDYXXLXY domain-containing protein [Pasteurella multocida]MCW4599519.1 GDYXXLXY domain-containing protein [Pasteurella multocida subsp. multocida]MDY0625195.1 GDYXXLXY domain-containing protein [Pasteurella multocida]